MLAVSSLCRTGVVAENHVVVALRPTNLGIRIDNPNVRLGEVAPKGALVLRLELPDLEVANSSRPIFCVQIAVAPEHLEGASLSDVDASPPELPYHRLRRRQSERSPGHPENSAEFGPKLMHNASHDFAWVCSAVAAAYARTQQEPCLNTGTLNPQAPKAEEFSAALRPT